MRSILVLTAALIFVQPALACSPNDLIDKQKKVADASALAHKISPGSDAIRGAAVKEIESHYADLSSIRDKQVLLDTACRQYDELLAVYK